MYFNDTPENVKKVAEETVWLLFHASSVVGMGVFQDRPKATKEEVLKTVYEDGPAKRMDYVFGRMVKASVYWTKDSVTVAPNQPHPEYQSWGRIYQDGEEAILAAAANLNVNVR